MGRPSVRVAELIPIPAPVKIGEWSFGRTERQLIPPTSNAVNLVWNDCLIRVTVFYSQDWLDELTPHRLALSSLSARNELFTEEQKNWQIPLSVRYHSLEALDSYSPRRPKWRVTFWLSMESLSLWQQ